MSRNQLYKNRLELCLSEKQHKMIKEMADKQDKRMNEIVRMAIELYYKQWKG